MICIIKKLNKTYLLFCLLADLLHVHSDSDDMEISSEPYTCIEAGTDHVDAIRGNN